MVTERNTFRVEDRAADIPLMTDTEAEPDSGEVLGICREVFDNAELELDDVFADSGGHSILIAQLTLRLQVAGWKVTVRDLLCECNTARKVAALPRELQQTFEPARVAAPPDCMCDEREGAEAEVLSVRLFTTLQALFLLLLYSPHLIGSMGLLGLVAMVQVGELFLSAHLRDFVLAGFLLYSLALLLPFANVLWVMVIKLFMGGDVYKSSVRPGVYPKWSTVHLRVWCIEQMGQSVLWPLRTTVRSAPLMAWALRRLGATVGDNLQCDHDVEFSGPLDLLSIGDDVAIQTGAYISTSRWVGQELHVGPVHLESGCKIGVRAAVANDVTVGRGSWITPLTPVLSDVGPEEMWQGAPARFSGRYTELKRTASSCRYVLPFWFLEALNILMQVALEFCLMVLPAAVISWWAASVIFLGAAGRASRYFEVAPRPEIVWHMGLYAFITTWVTLVLISVLGCVFLRCTSASPGLYPTRGLKGALLLYRVRKFNQIQRLWTWTITGQYLRALAGVSFPHIGGSECDLMNNLVPELVAADSQVFWSHGCFTNMLDHGAQYLKVSRLDMPANFFAGNNCVAESGQLPSNFLLGVSTPASDIQFRRQMRSRLGVPITVAGNPPVKFGSADFEAENRAQELPSFPLFLGRIFLNDIFSIGLLPISEILSFAVFFTILLRSFGHPFLSGLAAVIPVECFMVGSAVLVKKLLVGSKWGDDDSTSFWSWRHLTYFFAQDCFFIWCRRPLRILAGTVFANVILRRMGCRIGRRTLFSGPLQAYDWNAVNIGDDCVVDGLLQLHSFENMTLKVKRTEIQNGSSINFGATIMGGAVIGPETTLLPLSLVLKEMHLPTAVYQGSPAEPVAENTQTIRQASPSSRASVGPVAPDSRITGVDMVRGVTLFAVLLANMYNFGADSVAWTSATNKVAFAIMHVFFESTSWMLFSMLFGFGFALQLERAEGSGSSILLTYLRRLVLLFVLGAANALLFDGDILMLYAELGLGLLLVRRLPTRILLLVALGLMLVFPLARLDVALERSLESRQTEGARAQLERAQRSHVYAVGSLAEVAADNASAIPADPLEDIATPESGLAVFAMFLIGFSVGRSGFLRNISGNAAQLARVRAWGLSLGLGAMVVERILAATTGYEVFRIQHAGPGAQLAGDLLYAFGSLFLALGYAATLILAAQTSRGKAVLAPLARVGRLSLSVYLIQTLMFTTLFYGYGFGQAFRLSPVAVTGWAVAFFAVQVIACQWWCKRFCFGPMEWLWRSVTYLKWQPMRLRSNSMP